MVAWPLLQGRYIMRAAFEAAKGELGPVAYAYDGCNQLYTPMSDKLGEFIADGATGPDPGQSFSRGLKLPCVSSRAVASRSSTLPYTVS